MSFGQFCTFAWGDAISETPLITDKLPVNGLTYAVKFLFCFNLIITYPLQIYPTYLIIEN